MECPKGPGGCGQIDPRRARTHRVAGAGSIQGQCDQAGDFSFPAFGNDRGTERRARVSARADLGSARRPSSRAFEKLLGRVAPRTARIASSLEGALFLLERAAKGAAGE